MLEGSDAIISFLFLESLTPTLRLRAGPHAVHKAGSLGFAGVQLETLVALDGRHGTRPCAIHPHLAVAGLRWDAAAVAEGRRLRLRVMDRENDT